MIALAPWLRSAAEALADVSESPRLDAELLAAHMLGMSRDEMLLSLPRLDVPESAEALLARRLASEPIAYITGTRDFWTLSLHVRPGVLVPRPDSETLIEAAIELFAPNAAGSRRAPRRILDLGTGTGALLLAALDEWKDATGLGIDASPAALAVAEENARRNAMEGRASFRLGDWGADIPERFDLILCNPPYIRESAVLAPDVRDHEPAMALFAGPEGLDAYRTLAGQIARLLAPDGAAIFEIGYDQEEAAGALFREAGFHVSARNDLAGRARALIVTDK